MLNARANAMIYDINISGFSSKLLVTSLVSASVTTCIILVQYIHSYIHAYKYQPTFMKASKRNHVIKSAGSAFFFLFSLEGEERVILSF